ncbi:ABC transporter permease [Actinocorallia aurantiaca]|uniref:ABC transporter permease n=1 Tax=Actinocorallia aurantiaca TaxID=46204 RepID=A0ABP6GZK8_9ACTN
MRRWGAELALGMRLSVSGGRSGWVRLVMIAIGVGLGVAMLLAAATIPNLMAARDVRLTARTVELNQPVPQGPDTLLVNSGGTEYRGRTINGELVRAEGDRAPLPPGVERLPAPGEMVVSPALAELLASDEGALLRGRWNERVIGMIGPEGLSGPREYFFYLGTDRLTRDSAVRSRSFGIAQSREGAMATVLLLLCLIGLVALLLPVAVFLTSAVRFGGEGRDRRLAALRLVGADAAMTRRIAAGETLVGALLGLVVGGLLFLAAGLLAYRFVPAAVSFYSADFRPVPALAALVVVLVPVTAVLATVFALRRVVVEPLGVVRRADERRRRLWWRLFLPVAGLALLYPLRDGLSTLSYGDVYQVMAGVAALLAGVALLLPWLVEAVVHRLGGGGVAWELAVRRLQLDSGTAVRAVSGIAVSVAGAIALQGLLATVQAQYTVETRHGTDRFQALVTPNDEQSGQGGRWKEALEKTSGVLAVEPLTLIMPTQSGGQEGYAGLQIGSCAVLQQFAELGSCTDGDTFVISDPGVPQPRPGEAYFLDSARSEASRWTLPPTVRTVPPTQGDIHRSGAPAILVTPKALKGVRTDPTSAGLYVALDPSDPDAVERLRNTVARTDPTAHVAPVIERTVLSTLVKIRQALLAGATALLLLIGASMLVNVAEQLRERRRVLAVLMAFGTRRSTLAGSVLYQVAVPVLLGLALAVATGTGLAAILQAAAEVPVQPDWSGIGATSGAAVLVVLLTTAASLPLLWRLTSPGGLRSE